MTGRDWSTKSLSNRLGKMKSDITGIHPSSDLTREGTIVQQKPQPAYSIPVALVADVLLEGRAGLPRQWQWKPVPRRDRRPTRPQSSPNPLPRGKRVWNGLFDLRLFPREIVRRAELSPFFGHCDYEVCRRCLTKRCRGASYFFQDIRGDRISL